ncbi:MAG: hypothetical protein HY046_05275 [Acidobacteria bacterium]|nr:hypothetical protein [Acidobacteriota bacterium]
MNMYALKYIWTTTKGHRFAPWKSPYLRWRFETFFGNNAADLDFRKFCDLMWRERVRMQRFLEWAEEQGKRKDSTSQKTRFSPRKDPTADA